MESVTRVIERNKEEAKARKKTKKLISYFNVKKTQKPKK